MLKTLNQGIHSGVPMADYIADPAPAPSLSTGTACAIINECPAAARARHPRLSPEYEQSHSSASDIGSIAHDVLLMDDRSRVVLVQATDWRTKDAKAQREQAQAEGKITILADRWPKIEAMTKIARDALGKVANDLVGDPDGMEYEQTIIWQEGGPWCRSRPDILFRNFDYAIDYKTTATSANPNAVAKLIANQGYDVQAALVRAGTHAITGKTPDVIFMVQEVDPPYLVSFVGMAPMFAEMADKKLERAVATWKSCITTGRWPGYPAQVAWVDPPPWEIARYEAMA